MGVRGAALRRAWFQVHKWIGLILMIVLIPLSLSGSALVWHDWLDARLNPQRAAASGAATLAPSAYAAAARAAVPGGVVANIRWPEGQGAVVVSLAKPGKQDRPGPPQRTNVWLDPPTAKVLDVAGSNDGVVRFLHSFHGNLTVPGVGRQIVGWLGVFLFLSCATGLWIWFPTVGRWTRGLRWSAARSVDTNLHHQIGFWIVLPLGMLAFTGVWIAFPQMIGGAGGPPRAAGARPGGGGGDAFARFRAKPLAAPRLSPDAALAAARAAGGGEPTVLNWPTDQSADWRVTLARKGARPADYAVDDASGVASPARGNREGGGIARLMRQWHDGTNMGPVWRAVIFAAGLAPAVLGVTGILMWLRTRRWRARAARGREARVAPAE